MTALSSGPAESELLLVVDVGNTQTVIGIYEERQEAEATDVSSTSDSLPASALPARKARDNLVGHWRVATEANRTEDELAVLIDGFFMVHEHKSPTRKSPTSKSPPRKSLSDITGVAISSGVPRVTASLRSMVSRYLNCEPVVIAPGIKTGISILYDNPKEVGADRIANAAGAYDLFRTACVVVDFGTGTTFDAISAKGEYLGGAISPGVEISLEALVGKAAALQSVELRKPRSVIGKSTMESIQSGVLYGFGSQVDGMCRLFLEEMGEALVVATGGIADIVVPYTQSVCEVEPWLTLHGLRVVWERNQES